VSPDGLTWTFHLRKGAAFSDGHPMTAADVLFSFQLAYDETLHPSVQDLLVSNGRKWEISAPDDYTFVIKVPSPNAMVIPLSGSVPVLPKHVLEPIFKAGNFASAYNISTPPEQIVTSGPFRLKQYVAGANELADKLTEAAQGTVKLAAGLTRLSGGLNQYQQAMANASKDPTSLGIQCPFQTQAECQAFYTGLGYGTGAAAQGVDPIATGLGQLSNGLNDQLPSKKEQQKQAKQLAEFKAGGKKLVTGSAALGSGLGQLSGGIAQVADGASRLADGLPKLTSGVSQYTNGVGQVADGARKLSDGLAKGADKVPSFSKAGREFKRCASSPQMATGMRPASSATIPTRRRTDGWSSM